MTKNFLPFKTASLVTLLFWLSGLCAVFMPCSAFGAEHMLRVGVYQNSPGVFWGADGKIKGFYVDLLQHISDQEGWTLDYIKGTWSEGLSGLQDGTIDLLVAIAVTSQRDALFDFPKEAALSNWGQLYTQDKTIQSVMDLMDRRVAGLKDDIYTHKFQNLLLQFEVRHQWLETPEYGEALRLLDIGEVDAAIISRTYGLINDIRYNVHKSSIICCAMGISYAVLEGHHRDIIMAIDKHLSALKKDSDSLYHYSVEKWFGSTIQRVMPVWVYWSSGLGLAILVLFVFGNIVLRRQIRLQTHALNASVVKLRKQHQELSVAMKAAHVANQAKSDFLANMSHEIRTPMNAIIGLNDLALKQDLHPKVRDYLRKTRTASISLLRIINDILDFSKIEAGKLDLENIPFYLVETFENIGNLFQNKIAENNVEFIISLPANLLLEVVGDPLRLEQVFVNLISNALKFTKDGEVVLHAHCLQKTAQEVRIQFSVRDSGIGISKEQQSALFQAFSQADSSTTRRFGGTGLGLAISKQLVEMMNGKIWVESEQGKGSEFCFTASFGVGLTLSHTPIVFDKDLQNLTVLVVDDNVTSQKVTKEMLQTFSVSVTTVGSGDEALAELRRAHAAHNPFAMVLVDYRMPVKTGFEVAAEIKEEKGLFHTLPNHSPPVTIPKIVLMTSFTGDEIQKGVEKQALDGWIEKPFSRLLLFDTIQSVFGKEVSTHFRDKHQPGVAQQVQEKISGARILLVDDVALNCQVASEILQGMGLRVDLAFNGQEAVHKVEQDGPYDAVLMDLQMPVMDGYEATRTIRQKATHAKRPIIALTAHALDGIWEKCRAAGMNDHVAKPIDTAELCKTLLRWIPEKTTHENSMAVALSKQVPPPQEDKTATLLPATLPGLDISAALHRMNGNTFFLRKILVDFHREFSDSSKKIRADLEGAGEEGRVTARALAHTVKGMAGNISADNLFQAARELENGIHAKKRDTWPLLLDRFEQAASQVMHSIQTFVIHVDPGVVEEDVSGAEILNDTELKHLMQEVYRLLRECDSDTMDHVASLKASLQEEATLREMKQLEACLQDFDFDAALVPFKAIAKFKNISLDA